MPDIKPTVTLEGWMITDGVLIGSAYGHPRFEDGTFVRTSTILHRPNHPKKGDTIETRNTLYKLGGKAKS